MPIIHLQKLNPAPVYTHHTLKALGTCLSRGPGEVSYPQRVNCIAGYSVRPEPRTASPKRTAETICFSFDYSDLYF